MKENKNHICPVWVGRLMVNPLRRLGQHPDKIVGSYLEPGMKVMDFGCAMGYFSIPMARKVGEKGVVYCVDIQEKMLTQLMKRAKRKNVHPIIKPTLIPGNNGYTDLPDQLDFVLLFAVVHEVPDKKKLFDAISERMNEGGKVLFAEPSGRVNASQFKDSLGYAESSGLIRVAPLKIYRSHAMLLSKNGN
ncbi:MAG: methyltransferase domain-containing protein [Bacteroidales bacterium]|nr:methyltransferase domain-containing protein [Bacteroidales bacterium]